MTEDEKLMMQLRLQCLQVAARNCGDHYHVNELIADATHLINFVTDATLPWNGEDVTADSHPVN